MKTITIRDLRRRWLEIEAALQVEDEILITRDSKPVAKLVRFVPPKSKRKRWNPAEHERWIKKVFGNKMFPDGDAELAEARADREFHADPVGWQNNSRRDADWGDPNGRAPRYGQIVSQPDRHDTFKKKANQFDFLSRDLPPPSQRLWRAGSAARMDFDTVLAIFLIGLFASNWFDAFIPRWLAVEFRARHIRPTPLYERGTAVSGEIGRS